MWEAIASNKRRSWALIGLMGALLVTFGFLVGLYVDPKAGGAIGAVAALGLWLVLWVAAAFAGDDILLLSVGARRIEKADSPRLWNVIEEMIIAAGLSQMPAVYIIENDSPNAFAVGRKPEAAAVAVTSGLLRRLTRDELQGVVAHEIGHIRNLDVRFMTLAAVLLASITLISDVFLRSLRYTGVRRSSSREGGDQAQLVILALTLVVALLGPIGAHLLYLACSRRREFLADASSARFTRFPEGLASALEKIQQQAGFLKESGRVAAPMFIVNPLQARSDGGLFSTHPPTGERVQILRAMAGKAGFSDYEAAYRQVRGAGGSCLGERTLGAGDSLAARQAVHDPEDEAIGRGREAANFLARVGQFLYVPCACGVNIKVPPDFPGPTVACPRCGVTHDVPRAEEIPAPGTAAGAPSKPAAPVIQRYVRRRAGWESFRCRCGRVIQLSPAVTAQTVRCPGCNQKIELAPFRGMS